MDVKALFSQAFYDEILVELADSLAFPYFPIPAGSWYITDTEPEPQFAEQDTSLYLCGEGKWLRILNPEDPKNGTCYRWI